MATPAVAHTGEETRATRRAVVRRRRAAILGAFLILALLCPLLVLAAGAGALPLDRAANVFGAAAVVALLEATTARLLPPAVDRDVMFARRLPWRALLDHNELGEIRPEEVVEARLLIARLPTPRIPDAERWTVNVQARRGLRASFSGLPRATLQRAQGLVMDGKTPQMQQAVAAQVWKMGGSVEAAVDWAKDHGAALKEVRVDVRL